MSEKQSLLKNIAEALRQRGLAEEDIDEYLKQNDSFFERLIAASSEKPIPPVDWLADGIAKQIERADEAKKQAAAVETKSIDKITPQVIEKQAESESPVGGDDSDSGERKAEGIENLSENPAEDETSDAGDSGNSERSQDQAETSDNDGIADMEDAEAEPKPLVNENTVLEENKLPDYISEEPVPNCTLFWILFAVSAPITLPLALAALVLTAGVWAALGIIVAASVAALVAVCAGGTLLSVIGIIYGALQLAESRAVGMYEIGLGILIGGISMFVGILIYNFAVRFMPLVFRWAAEFFRWAFKRIKGLFNYLRRECARL